jgi:hypothetical protein
MQLPDASPDLNVVCSGLHCSYGSVARYCTQHFAKAILLLPPELDSLESRDSGTVCVAVNTLSELQDSMTWALRNFCRAGDSIRCAAECRIACIHTAFAMPFAWLLTHASSLRVRLCLCMPVSCGVAMLLSAVCLPLTCFCCSVLRAAEETVTGRAAGSDQTSIMLGLQEQVSSLDLSLLIHACMHARHVVHAEAHLAWA